MTSGSEQSARAAREAKGLPEPDGSTLITRIILKELNMGFIGKIAAMFSEKYVKAISAFIGAGIGFGVGRLFAFLVENGLGTCVVDICTISFAGYHWSSAEATVWITGIVMAWISTHAVKSAPANK